MVTNMSQRCPFRGLEGVTEPPLAPCFPMQLSSRDRADLPPCAIAIAWAERPAGATRRCSLASKRQRQIPTGRPAPSGVEPTGRCPAL